MTTVVIVGGGAVALSFAHFLSNLPVTVHIFEKNSQATLLNTSRAILLNWETTKVLERHALWSAIAPYGFPVTEVRVTAVGHLGGIRFLAEDFSLPALGFNVPLSHLMRPLLEKLSLQSNMHFHFDSMVTKEELAELKPDLTVYADGGGVQDRELLSIPRYESSYGHMAMISTVQFENPEPTLSLERFTQYGALAVLPLGKESVLVYSVDTEKEKDMLQWKDEAIIEKMNAILHKRFGEIERHAPVMRVPLIEALSNKVIGDHMVLLGNRAHALHPVAAQGFNLSVREADFLAESVKQALGQKNPIGSHAVLTQYLKSIDGFSRTVIAATNAVAHYGASHAIPLSVRALGLNMIAGLPFIKQHIAALGLGRGI